MSLRRFAVGSLLALALGASIASPAPPNTQQAPLWAGSAYYSLPAPHHLYKQESMAYALAASFTLPTDGSGGWTSKLVIYPDLNPDYAGSVTFTFTDAEGAELATETFTVPVDESTRPQVRVDDVFPDCTPGELCSTTVTLTVTATTGEAEYSFEADLSARDDELGAESSSVELSLAVTAAE